MFNAGIELPLTIHVHRTNVVLVCPTPAGPIVSAFVNNRRVLVRLHPYARRCGNRHYPWSPMG